MGLGSLKKKYIYIYIYIITTLPNEREKKNSCGFQLINSTGEVSDC